MAFTADGIYYQTQNDAFDVAGDSEAQAKSIPGVIVPVANATERDAYLDSRTAEGRPPTGSSPIYVRRTDTRTIQVNDGGGWDDVPTFDQIIPARADGWEISLNQGAPRLVRVGLKVFLTAYLSRPSTPVTIGTAGTGSTVLTNLPPDGFEPEGSGDLVLGFGYAKGTLVEVIYSKTEDRVSIRAIGSSITIDPPSDRVIIDVSWTTGQDRPLL